jgi:hypothetical protein
MSDKRARARKQKRERRDANAANTANAGDAIPGLLNDIVVTHVLRSEHFDDPADLARLPAVSRAMRDAVAATGLQFAELGELRRAQIGCLSSLQRRQRGGRLSRQEYLCEAAAGSGNLEELKALRGNGCPWDAFTCFRAARGGHFEVLQWARVNDCPWDRWTCAMAAQGGHLEVLKWLRTRRRAGTSRCCSGRARTAALGTSARAVLREGTYWSGRWRTAYPIDEVD